jgi:hypothetical protein
MTITRPRPRPRFYIETALAVIFALTTVLILWRPDWIEALTGGDPDHGSGSAEWILAITCATTTLLVSGFARREWIRATTARATSLVKGPA